MDSRAKQAALAAENLEAMSPEETRKMLQDLRTVQIELQMQNEELRQAQAELDASRARYFDFYDMAPVGYVTVNEMGLILDANLTFAKMLGVTRSALVKQPISRFILKDDRDINYLHRKQVIETGEQHASELRMRKMDGTPFWGHLAAIAAEDVNGDPVCRIVVSDVTERRRAEEMQRASDEKYKIVADNTYDWEFWIGPDGRFIYNSPACKRATGIDAEMFMNDPELFVKIACEEDRPRVERHLREADSTQEPGEIEFRIVHADGSLRWIEHYCIPVFDGMGTFLGSRGSNRDITERKAAEAALRDVQRRESIRMLSSGIAHDYNNLLGIMMGNISLAQAKLSDPHPAAKNIERALAAMERAAELTRSMLAYAGMGKFEIRQVDIGAVIREHESLYKVSLPRHVAFSAHLPSTPVHVNGDPEQIEQIIMNLVINGGDAIGERKGVVSLVLAEAALGADDLARYGRIPNTMLPEGRYAVLEVSDSGNGMDRETMNKIFDPFFTTRFTGRGLGLPAVLGIIQGHDGGITVESEEGNGTTFRLILPAAAPPAPAEEPPIVPPPAYRPQ